MRFDRATRPAAREFAVLFLEADSLRFQHNSLVYCAAGPKGCYRPESRE